MRGIDADGIGELLDNDDVVYSATQIFDALSDSTRFQIIGVLLQGERGVSELQEVCGVSQSAARLASARPRALPTSACAAMASA